MKNKLTAFLNTPHKSYEQLVLAIFRVKQPTKMRWRRWMFYQTHTQKKHKKHNVACFAWNLLFSLSIPGEWTTNYNLHKKQKHWMDIISIQCVSELSDVFENGFYRPHIYRILLKWYILSLKCIHVHFSSLSVFKITYILTQKSYSI